MAVNTITVGPGRLTIGSDAELTVFESQVTECRLVPKADQGDPINVLSGEQVAGDRAESWTLEGSILQDIGSESSKVEWLFDHRGQSHPFTFIPSSKAGRQITGTLQVEAVALGGEASTKPTSDFEFVVEGAPVLGAIVSP